MTADAHPEAALRHRSPGDSLFNRLRFAHGSEETGSLSVNSMADSSTGAREYSADC